MSFLRRGGEPTEDEPGSSQTRYDFPDDWLSQALSSPCSSPAPAPVVETPRPLLVADFYESSPRASPRSFPIMTIPQPPPEVIISSSLTPSPRSYSIAAARKKAKRESSFGPSEASPASDGILVRAREGKSTRLSTSPGSTPVGGLNKVKRENSSSPSTSPGSIPIVGFSGAKRKFNSSPSSSRGELPYAGEAKRKFSSSPTTSPGSIPIGGLNEVKKENSSSPSTSPGFLPIVGLSGAKKKFSSCSPSPSPNASSVVSLPKPRAILNSRLSTSPAYIPVDGLNGLRSKLSPTSSTSTGSIPITKLSSGHSSPSHAAVLAALNLQREWSSRLNTLPGSIAVAGHHEVKQRTPLKQTMEVTVLEPPASTSNSIYERQRNLERRKWYNQVADLLPNDVLVVTSTRWTPEYPPPAQDEEELLRKAKGNAGAVTKGPPVRVGSAYHAIEETYSQRLDAEAYAKFGLFHNVESLWFRKYSKGDPPSRLVAKERKPYAKATLVSRLKS